MQNKPKKRKKVTRLSLSESARGSSIAFFSVTISAAVIALQVGAIWVTADNPHIQKTNKYTVITSEPDLSNLTMLKMNEDLEEYCFNNTTEVTTTSCSSTQGDYKLNTKIERIDNTSSMKQILNWTTDTESMVEFFADDEKTLGMQTMLFKNGETYTSIVKYNGKLDTTFVPYINIYQVTEVEDDVYKITECNNSGMTLFKKSDSQAVLDEVCLALNLNYSASDLLFISDVKSDKDSIFGADVNLESEGYTDEKYFGFDTTTGIITEYKGTLPNAPTIVIIPPTISGVEVRGIGNDAFYKYSSASRVTSVVIPDTVTFIGDKAFLANTLLKSVTMPSNLNSIGEKCFQDCSSLREIILSGSVREIPNSAFKNCSSLDSITLCGTETIIGESAFENCRILSEIYHTSSVTTVGSKAFKGTRVEAFEVESVEPDSFEEKE